MVVVLSVGSSVVVVVVGGGEGTLSVLKPRASNSAI
ncbi:MAG: Uncharacterised protein [Acidimicrobiales bacterium AG-410-I20]|nr:MAG: Uncharacterised protein [Acidimicrobiales bacterium AG-410-I20]